MTDVRKCDGPDCNVEVELNDNLMLAQISSLTADNFITVECQYRNKLHFHNDTCLKNYYKGDQ